MDKKTTKITGILMVSMLVCAGVVALIAFSPANRGTYSYTLNTFSSYDELRSFFQQRYENSLNLGRGMYTSPDIRLMTEAGMALDSAKGGEAPPSYSTTNVQVVGVDEPDIVKTDGTYLYVVANQVIYILKAYPISEAAMLSQISFDDNCYIRDIFIRGNRLVVFGNWYESAQYKYRDDLILEDNGDHNGLDNETSGNTEENDDESQPDSMVMPYIWWSTPQTIISIYDITDRSNPIEIKEVKIDGDYFDARLIDEYVYVVVTQYTYTIYQPYLEEDSVLAIPRISIDDESKDIEPEDIYYVDVPELSDTMTHIISLNLDTYEIAQKSFILGSSQTMYVSKNNIFLASVHYPYFGLLVRGQEPSAENTQETTILHKISITTGDIAYIAQGEVPGRVLNQFSMDEHNGFFRIATTVGNNWWFTQSQSKNNVYILDENLERVGQIENIAPGESIYAARFMGHRAYLVTFVQVDPLFTIDLSDPYNPKILGELKIPGYSNYLHPYDQDHIIGIGKEVDDTVATFAAIQGLKIALFDVSDFENPKEVSKIVIGDRGTDSPALYDHKAFLFDREKELLVIPVSLYEIPQEVKDKYIESEGLELLYGQFSFQGAYVYHLSRESGFDYQGRITHQSQEQMQQQAEDYYWYWGSSNTDITRSLYIGDVLYTISGAKVKMNDLTDLSELNSITLS